MSDKRFTVIFVDGDYWEMPYFFDDGEVISDYDVVDLLNAFHQENQQLKHYRLYEDNKRLQTIIAELKRANEQLQQEIIVYKKAFQQQVQRCTL